ncbi:MAG: translation initiation factor IF-5A [Candidatus Heimdallarchaeota archaeon]
MSTRPTTAGDLKEGRYMIDPKSNEPCKILSIDKSKPGKHGSAKARIVMVGVIDGRKREFVGPVSTRVNIPIIDKRTGLITSVAGDSIQVMDNEEYNTFETVLPEEENVRNKIISLFNAGKPVEVDYWIIMNHTKIIAAREQN